MFHVKQFIGIKKRGAEDIAPYNDTRMDICRGRRPGVPSVFLPVQALYFAF